MTALYIHYPYCKSKCPYCDFNSHVRDDIDFSALEDGYQSEIKYFSENVVDKNITSIFFGGGTPSLMPVFLVANILQHIANNFIIARDCEISLEANPTSSEAQKFQDLKTIGINRLSMGIQALKDDDLKFLGREHSADEAMATIAMAQKIFSNFSFDLIYARPKQDIQSWRQELALALSFEPKHLSLYQLTIEKGTKFFSQFQRQEFIMPDEKLASEFYDITNEIMAIHGFNHYEISNYAQDNYECRHNLAYWRSEDYIGIGAGAHSRVFFHDKKYRQAIQMIAEPNLWIKNNQIHHNGIQKIEDIDPTALVEEIIMMGLRLAEGIEVKVFDKYFNRNFMEILDAKKLNFLLQNDLLKFVDDKLFIPRDKMILTNAIIAKLLQDGVNV